MNLEPFEYTPPTQPVPEDPVIFTLRPLEMRGYMNMTAALAAGGMTNVDRQAEVAVRYVAGWRGGGQPAVTDPEEVRRRLASVLNGTPNLAWMSWLLSIARELKNRADPEEGDAKKF